MSNVWERLLREFDAEQELSFERAKQAVEDWVAFGRVHVLLQAAQDMLEEEAVDRSVDKAGRRLARDMANVLRKAAKEVEQNERQLKAPGEK